MPKLRIYCEDCKALHKAVTIYVRIYNPAKYDSIGLKAVCPESGALILKMNDMDRPIIDYFYGYKPDGVRTPSLKATTQEILEDSRKLRQKVEKHIDKVEKFHGKPISKPEPLSSPPYPNAPTVEEIKEMGAQELRDLCREWGLTPAKKKTYNIRKLRTFFRI